jgi:hypothetical protein
MEKIPGDDHIRNMLDGADPQHFDGLFLDAVHAVRAENDLTAFRRLNGHVLIALDGTEYARSNIVHCDKCSHSEHSDGRIEYFITDKFQWQIMTV